MTNGCTFSDEDMQSLASLMSTGAMMSDIAPLEDLDGEDEGQGNLQLQSLVHFPQKLQPLKSHLHIFLSFR
jgi:hypothetical protein